MSTPNNVLNQFSIYGLFVKLRKRIELSEITCVLI